MDNTPHFFDYLNQEVGFSLTIMIEMSDENDCFFGPWCTE